MCPKRGKGKSSNVTPVRRPTACIFPLKSNPWGITFQGMFDRANKALLVLTLKSLHYCAATLEGVILPVKCDGGNNFLLCIPLYSCFCSLGGVVGETRGAPKSMWHVLVETTSNIHSYKCIGFVAFKREQNDSLISRFRVMTQQRLCR